MTNHEIFRLFCKSIEGENDITSIVKSLRDKTVELLAEEREACAKVAETVKPFPEGCDHSPMDRVEAWRFTNTKEDIAKAIRART